RRHAFSCRALPLPTPLSNVDPVAAAKAQCRTRSNGVGCFRARVPKAFVQRASAFRLVAHCADQTADDGRELMGGDRRRCSRKNPAGLLVAFTAASFWTWCAHPGSSVANETPLSWGKLSIEPPGHPPRSLDFDQAMAALHITSASVALVENGKIAWSR